MRIKLEYEIQKIYKKATKRQMKKTDKKIEADR